MYLLGLGALNHENLLMKASTAMHHKKTSPSWSNSFTGYYLGLIRCGKIFWYG